MPPVDWALVRQGDTGPRVRAVQFLLRADGFGIDADGSFGPMTGGAGRDFQTQRGLAADGVVGNQTWPVLVIMGSRGSSGDAVRAAQVLLPPLALDGLFGPRRATHRASPCR